ncbi:MAG TPA: NAD(P)/FAD-dependent oxidoreductase [Bacillales bacterium]|nr:NAD(P)/FAD-dependent oxidoreductase [Bacillales bacterium]
MSKHVVILGAGYGGLMAALSTRQHFSGDVTSQDQHFYDNGTPSAQSHEEVSITLVNRVPNHEIITELHRLAAGNISEQAVALPLQKLIHGKGIDLKVANVEEISPDQQEVSLSNGEKLSYDALVVALGSETAHFGIPGLKENSFILKSVENANHIREYVETRIREYAKTQNKADGNFVVGGGGLTGIELAGEFADEIPKIARKYAVDPEELSLYVVEAAPTILPGFPEDLVDRAKSSLQKRGVEILTGLPVTKYEDDVVELKDGQKIETKVLVWTGGVQGNSVVANSGIEVNRGRATVNEYLQSTSHENVYVAGDSAVVFPPGAERPYPPTAQISWQMGELIGYNLFASFNDGALETFQPVFSGTLGSLGRKDAIGMIGGNETQLKGLPASLMKQASNMRYLAHIKGLFSLAY